MSYAQDKCVCKNSKFVSCKCICTLAKEQHNIEERKVKKNEREHNV